MDGHEQAKKRAHVPAHIHARARTHAHAQVIRVKLLSDLLGPFDETFTWTIKGSSTPLSLQFKGHVCGPSFEVDTDLIDFGVVSYGFRCVRERPPVCARACVHACMCVRAYVQIQLLPCIALLHTAGTPRSWC